MDRIWWCVKPPKALDLLFDNIPITSMDNPAANMIQVKKRHANESCLLGEALCNSCWEQTHMHPPSRLARTWDRVNRAAAPKASLKASWLGSLHSNIQSLKCLTLFCATSAWIARIPAATSMATIRRQTRTPPSLSIFVSYYDRALEDGFRERETNGKFFDEERVGTEVEERYKE